MKAKQNTFGFTLIEVMLAIAVFAIASVALYSSIAATSRNTGHLEQKSIASWVASNQLVMAHLEPTWPPKKNLKGKVEMSGVEWYWQQIVKETTDKDMRQIIVEVRLQEDAELPLASMMTYVSTGGK